MTGRHRAPEPPQDVRRWLRKDWRELLERAKTAAAEAAARWFP